MQVCDICGAQETNGNISLSADRNRHISVSNRDLHYTRCCQIAISRGRKGCLKPRPKLEVFESLVIPGQPERLFLQLGWIVPIFCKMVVCDNYAY